MSKVATSIRVKSLVLDDFVGHSTGCPRLLIKDVGRTYCLSGTYS